MVAMGRSRTELSSILGFWALLGNSASAAADAPLQKPQGLSQRHVGVKIDGHNGGLVL